MATTFKSVIDWPNGSSTLNANITSAVETIVLASDPGTAMSASNFYVRIGFEQILVASRSGAMLTCTGGRGANGTTAAAHFAGDTVEQDFFAADVTAMRTAINAVENQAQKQNANGNFATSPLFLDNIDAIFGTDSDIKIGSLATGVLSIRDASGNVLMTLTDAGTTGNANITGNLIVGGTGIFSGALTVNAIGTVSAPQDGTYPNLVGQLQVVSTAAQSTGVGAVIALLGKYNAAGNTTTMGVVRVGKENAVSGEYGATLYLGARLQGSTVMSEVSIDNTGKLTVPGGIVSGGREMSTPSATQSIAAATGITAAMVGAYRTVMVVGNGGAIDITANPQIAAGTSGQLIRFIGTSDTNTVKFDNGTGLVGAGGTLGLNDVLMYQYIGSSWVQLGAIQNN